MTGTFLCEDVERRSSDIAGRGYFRTVPLTGGGMVWRGDPSDCPFNHSCDPTLWWSGDVLVARRAVRPGEELTVDYSTSTADPSFLLACHCESYRCRQMVTGDDWRIPQLQQRYAGHFAAEVQYLVNSQAVGE